MIKIQVRADRLPNLLDEAPQGIEYLSLDCFDTLLWRNVHRPVDVFADIPFEGGATSPRISAEQSARRVAINAEERYDITLDEIYSYMVPDSQAAERSVLVEAELEAEAQHCFGFAPIRDLMIEGKKRGLKIIVVSDTYLSEERLRTLIGRTAGEDVLAMIDHMFVSCEYGVGKARGLFEHVLTALDAQPEALLHVGDNPVADQQAPSELGINTVHLIQFDETTEQRLRLEAAAAVMMEPATRVSVPVIQGHRAQLATRTNDDPVFMFGHDVLGPIMKGFASWLLEEAEEMERRVGKQVKLLFLMRDGHLPAKSFRTLYPEWADRAVSIDLSRFTAYAASFTDAKAVETYLMPLLRPGSGGGPDLARQLLFSDDECLDIAEMEGNFLQRVTRPDMVSTIVARSAVFRERVLAHLRRHGVQDGDAVMLVDTGYNGTTQNVIEPILRDQMNLTVAGRYLVLREFWRAGNDKKGLFDVRNYDSSALTSLYWDVSVLEHFCTIGRGSVIDYTDDGTPIYDAHTIGLQQGACRARAQEACLCYLRDADAAQVAPPRSDDADGRRRTAMSVLARFLFLPLASEVEMLESFHHDKNQGTDWIIPMVDAEAARNGLRRRGLFYMNNAQRIFLPGELQPHGMAASLSSFSAARFSLDLRKTDFDVGGIGLPIAVLDSAGNTTDTVQAFPTAEGYYHAAIPIGVSRYSVGLRLGMLYEYVQIEEVGFHRVKSLTSTVVIPGTPITEGMTEIAQGFFRIDAPEGFMLVPPPPPQEGFEEAEMLLSVVFRPILARTGTTLSYQKAA